MVIYGYIMLHMVLYGYIWLYMVIYGYIWLYMIIYLVGGYNMTKPHIYTGWWYIYPYEKSMKVNWDDEIPNIWKNKKMFQTTNQIIKP